MKEKQIKQRKNRMDRADEIAIIDVVPLFDFHLEDWGLFRTLTHTCERKKNNKNNQLRRFESNSRRRLRFKRRIRFLRHLARIVD